MQALWAITVGRATFHMYSNLSELYTLRETVDRMILDLETIQKEKIAEAEQRKLTMEGMKQLPRVIKRGKKK